LSNHIKSDVLVFYSDCLLVVNLLRFRCRVFNLMFLSYYIGIYHNKTVRKLP